MKRGTTWSILLLLHIAFSITLLQSIHFQAYRFELQDYENKTAVFFLPIFYLIMLTIMFSILIIAGLTGLKYLKNTTMLLSDIFMKTDDRLAVKILKIISFLLQGIYLFAIYVSIMSKDMWAVISCVLLILINGLYCVWFSSVLLMEAKRNDYNVT